MLIKIKSRRQILNNPDIRVTEFNVKNQVSVINMNKNNYYLNVNNDDGFLGFYINKTIRVNYNDNINMYFTLNENYAFYPWMVEEIVDEDD